MNQKLCKILRGIARGKTAGMPERRLLAKEHRNVLNRVVSVTAINDPNTVRGRYRALKKAARA